MTATPTPLPPFRLNIEECVRFLGRDPHWARKLGLGLLWILLSFLIVPAFFVQGYMLLLMERVSRGESYPLPEWDDYGGLLRRGWRVFLTHLGYQLPLILLGFVIAVLLFGVIAALFSALLGSRSGNPGPNPFVFSPLLLLLILPLGLLLMLLGILIGLILPAAWAQLVLRDELGAAFDFRAVFAFIRRNLGQYAVAVAINFGAGLLLGGLSFGTNFTTRAGSGRQFWTEPLFLIGIAVTLLLIGVRVVLTYFIQLCFSHLIGQLCWYDRQATAIADTGRPGMSG